MAWSDELPRVASRRLPSAHVVNNVYKDRNTEPGGTVDKQPDAAASGFSGANPYEIAQRYHLGYISEQQLMDELSRWEYLPEPEPEHILDDGGPNPPGTWDDIVRAHRNELISEEQYARLLALLSEPPANRGREGAPDGESSD